MNVVLNYIYFLSQTYPNLPARIVLLWKRVLQWKQSWMLFATITLVSFRIISESCGLLIFNYIWVSFKLLIYIFPNQMINFFSVLHSCDCQNSPPPSTHGRARIWSWGPGGVYPPGISAALWHPTSTPAVAPHQPSMCQCPCAPWTVTAFCAHWFCAAWWHSCTRPSLPLAQKRRKHCSSHSQVETPQMLNGLILVKAGPFNLCLKCRITYKPTLCMIPHLKHYLRQSEWVILRWRVSWHWVKKNL